MSTASGPKDQSSGASRTAASALSSPARRAGNKLYISGIVACDPSGDVIEPGDAASQARYCFDRLRALVEAAGGTLDDIVKVNMYLTDYAVAPAVRAVRLATFAPPYPAWSTLAVAALDRPGQLVCVDAVAALK